MKQDLRLAFGVLLCISAAIFIKVTSADSKLVDVEAGIFFAAAIGFALPIQFERFARTIGPFVPWKRPSAATQAIVDVQTAKDATAKAAESVQAALKPTEKPE